MYAPRDDLHISHTQTHTHARDCRLREWIISWRNSGQREKEEALT